MSFKISFKSPERWTVMEVRRQRIPESRSRHREAAVCTSQTGARYSQAHSGTGRARCPAWRILADHGAHVDWCVIGVQGLVKEAHQFVADSLVDRQLVQTTQPVLGNNRVAYMWQCESTISKIVHKTWHGDIWYLALPLLGIMAKVLFPLQDHFLALTSAYFMEIDTCWMGPDWFNR